MVYRLWLGLPRYYCQNYSLGLSHITTEIAQVISVYQLSHVSPLQKRQTNTVMSRDRKLQVTLYTYPCLVFIQIVYKKVKKSRPSWCGGGDFNPAVHARAGEKAPVYIKNVNPPPPKGAIPGIEDKGDFILSHLNEDHKRICPHTLTSRNIKSLAGEVTNIISWQWHRSRMGHLKSASEYSVL